MSNNRFLRIMKWDTLEGSVRRVIFLPLIFAFTSFLAIVVTAPNYLSKPTQALLAVILSNLCMLVLNTVCYILIRRGRVRLGIWIMLVGTWWNLAFTGVLYQGLGIILSVSAIFLTVFVMVLAFTGRDRLWAILGGVLVGYLIFGVDNITSIDMSWRQPTVSGESAYAIMIGMLVVAGIILAIQFRNFSLPGKLITTFLSITVIVAVVLALVLVNVSQVRLRNLIGGQLKNYARENGIIIGDALNQQINMLTTLSQDNTLIQEVEAANGVYTGREADIQSRLQELDAEWISAADDTEPLIANRINQPAAYDLRNFRQLFPDHVELFVTDVYGGIVAATNRTSDYNQGDEGWWQSAYNNGAGAVYIGTPEYDDSSQTYAINMAIPVHNDRAEVIGVLRTTYNANAIVNIIKNTQAGETGEFDLVIPGENPVVFHQGGTEAITPAFMALLQVGEQKPYSQEIYDGEQVLLSQSPVVSIDDNPAIANLDWKVVFHQATSEAFSTIQSQLRIITMVVYVLVGLMALIGYGVSLLLSRPILHLTQAAEKVSAGDLSVRAEVESRDEIGALANAFNTMTGQLNEMVGTLEQRVAARTRALTTSTEVSRQLSTILDQQELVSQVVQQVQSAFNYYHVHIYLFDASRENLVMAGGTGEAGKTMLAQGHQIARGHGLVGTVGESNLPLLVGDTSQNPNWLPNPLLPDTKSEVTVPIATGARVLGVLDVQHNVANGLTQADVDLLQSIAGQVAIALQNARSFDEARHQAEREAQAVTIGQRIRQTTTVDEALQVAVRELGRLVGSPKTRIRLGVNVEKNTYGE